MGMLVSGLIIILSGGLVLLSGWSGKLGVKESQMSSPFECGFETFNLARVGFSLQFFLIGLLFLIFDIEIVLLLMYPLVSQSSFKVLSGGGSLVMILFGGVLIEWKNGHLVWV